MAKNEFSSPVAIDFAPSGSSCQWCGQAAEYELTAIGGAFHNMSALFCRSCGNEFVNFVTSSYDLDIRAATKRDEVPRTAPVGYAADSEIPGD